MPRKWTNSKGINVFSEKTSERSLNFIKREIRDAQQKKDKVDRKPVKPMKKRK